MSVKTRVIAAVVLLPLLLLVLMALPPIFTAVLLAAMSAVAAYELLWGTGLVKHPRLIAYAMAEAAFIGIWCGLGSPYAWGFLGVLVFVFALFIEMLCANTKLGFDKIMICMAGGLLVPYLLCAIMRIRCMELGASLVLLPFLLAFMSDSGAYFVGIFFGKHKLAPVISPKKTVEGMAGGVAAAVLGVMIYGLVLWLGFGYKVNFLYGALYGVAGSLASVLGDLTFSVVKRQTGIKDYGNLIPGHGGILDRFDSMTVVGPVAELLLLLLPFAEKIHG